jgi:hypothetical protein
VKNILLASVFMICLAAFGCQNTVENYPVEFVDRHTVFELEKKQNPLLLVVEIGENGKLSLNKIETGTVSDPSVLSEKIEAIFKDREKAGIAEKEIFIELQGTIRGADLENLIKSLAAAKAAPIRVIKTIRSK